MWIFLLVYVIVDFIYTLTVRIKPKLDYLEATHEIPLFYTFKIVLCVIVLVGIKKFHESSMYKYATLLGSLSLFFLILLDGPLHHIYYLYSDLTLWVLFFLATYLSVYSLKELKK